MDIKVVARNTGLLDKDLIGKSDEQIIKLISKTLKEQSKNNQKDKLKVYIENTKNKLPKLIESLKESFEICVHSVGQNKKPTTVKVVGYNPETKEVVIFHKGKYYQSMDNEIIKSVEEYDKLILMDNKRKKEITKK